MKDIKPNDMGKFFHEEEMSVVPVERCLREHGILVEDCYIDEENGSLIIYAPGEDLIDEICDIVIELQYDKKYNLDINEIECVLYNVDDDIYQYFIPRLD